MRNSIQKGFTLIELLVVIAIIGILAGILFVAIDPSSKIDDANIAKIKASLQGVPTAATVFYTDNNRYSYDDGTNNFCDSTSMASLKNNNYTCNNADQAWAVEKELNGTYYCIDSTGDGIQELSGTIGSATSC